MPQCRLCSTGVSCRETSRARCGRPGLCGVLPCCCWARLQRVQRLEWTGRPGRLRERWCGLLVCDRSVDCLSWSPPSRPLLADTMWALMVVEVRARSQCCCQLGPPRDRRRLSGGRLRPTDRAMAAARSACRRARRSPINRRG